MMHGPPLWDTPLPRICAGMQVSVALPRQRNAQNLPKAALVTAKRRETRAQTAMRLDEGGVIVSLGPKGAHRLAEGWQG